MKRVGLWLLCASLLFVAACAGSIKTDYALLQPQRDPFHGRVQLVRAAATPPGDVHEIAIVHAVVSNHEASVPDALDALADRAAMLGCNIVVRVEVAPGRPLSATGVCGWTHD